MQHSPPPPAESIDGKARSDAHARWHAEASARRARGLQRPLDAEAAEQKVALAAAAASVAELERQLARVITGVARELPNAAAAVSEQEAVALGELVQRVEAKTVAVQMQLQAVAGRCSAVEASLAVPAAARVGMGAGTTGLLLAALEVARPCLLGGGLAVGWAARRDAERLGFAMRVLLAAELSPATAVVCAPFCTPTPPSPRTPRCRVPLAAAVHGLNALACEWQLRHRELSAHVAAGVLMMLMDALEADPQLCEEARGRAGDAVRTGRRRAAVLPLALRHCVPTARACVAALLAALTAAALCAYLQVTRLRLGPPRSTAKASPEALWEQAKTWAASGGGGRGSSLSPSVRRRGGRGCGRAPATPVAARAVPPPGPALSSPEVQKAMLEEAARPLRLSSGTRGTKRLLDDKWAEINGVACDQLTVRAKAVHTTAVAPQAGGDNPARSLKVRHVAPCTCAMRAVCWLLAVAVMFAVCRMCATGCAARCAARVAVARVCPHAARSV